MTIFEGREPTTGPSRDRGAVLPLFALMLVVLLAFVALAVDVGQLYAERRQDQAAVDSGALSGAYQAVLSTTRTDQAIFDEVTKISYDSLDPDTRPATLNAWRALWPACSDSVGAASPIYGGNNQRINPSLGRIDCIRKSSNGTRIRVKLPTRTLNTFFARVLGVNTVSSTAVAEAGLNPVNTGVLPFAVSATGAGGDVICLKEPPNGLTPGQICPGSTQGNFGYVGSPRPSWDSNQACNGGQNTVVQQNIAQGLDHNLTEWTGTTVADQCTGVAVLGTPTAQFFQTGNIQSTIEDGFITAAQESGSFADGQPARLARSSPCVVNGGVNQNGIPRTQALPQQPSKILEWCGVWDYMVPNLVQGSDPATQVPPACYQLATVGASQNLAGVKACFAAYAAGGYTSQLFTANLRTANRFAWIPESIEDIGTLSPPRQFRIQRFRAIFVQTLYYRQTGYDPGQALPACNGNCNQFDSVTALLFDSNMLPAQIRTPYSGNNTASSIALLR